MSNSASTHKNHKTKSKQQTNLDSQNKYQRSNQQMLQKQEYGVIQDLTNFDPDRENQPQNLSCPNKKKKNRIIIYNLPNDVNEKMIKKWLSPFGQIKQFQIPTHAQKKSKKMFAFVEFLSKNQCHCAINRLNQTQWKGKTVTLNFAIYQYDYQNAITMKDFTDDEQNDNQKAQNQDVDQQQEEQQQQQRQQKEDQQSGQQYIIKNRSKAQTVKTKKQKKKKSEVESFQHEEKRQKKIKTNKRIKAQNPITVFQEQEQANPEKKHKKIPKQLANLLGIKISNKKKPKKQNLEMKDISEGEPKQRQFKNSQKKQENTQKNTNQEQTRKQTGTKNEINKAENQQDLQKKIQHEHESEDRKEKRKKNKKKISQETKHETKQKQSQEQSQKVMKKLKKSKQSKAKRDLQNKDNPVQ